MNSAQGNRLGMYFTVVDYSEVYQKIIERIPNFIPNLNILKDVIPKIQMFSELQKAGNRGITESKNTLRELLAVKGSDNSRKLLAFAKFTNNTALAQEINFSESKLRQCTDIAIKDYVQIIYNRGQTYLRQLSSYDISEETQSSLLNVINDYNAIMGKPGASRIESAQYTQQLAELYKMGDNALNNMDAGAEIVRLSEPNFYNGYKNSRKVVDKSSGSLSLRGTVTEAATCEGIKGATITFAFNVALSKLPAGQAIPENIVKQTADKGGFNIKSMPAGVYTVTISKVGYVDYTTTVVVSDEDLTVLNIQLTKI